MNCDLTSVAAQIRVEQLQFGYRATQPIAHHLTFTLQSGETVGLVGPNGAGKTSLFLLLTGLLTPQAGKIYLSDRPLKSGQFIPEIGLVFQNPDDQLFCASVWDDVAFGAENLGWPPGQVQTAVQQALNTTGVVHLAQRSPHQLSGGEKTMAAIASVLVMNPLVMLYDEPSAHLDLAARRRLINFLQTTPQTNLIASHDLALILEVCDRVLLLDQGQILADGPPKTILADESLLTAHHLEVPGQLR
ncbi:MAG: energy-coupling factor ABC transporter ATP-binding protein [Spirulina sp. SIO3F2]|nr:energy-coupling factor ABC transporter ATP-binding protein [Spirulina sp. SIO3F2]